MHKISSFVLAVSLIGSVPALAGTAASGKDMSSPNAALPAGSAWSPGHEPHSLAASNIDAADTKTAYAPALPPPPAGDDASIARLLRDATQALDRHQTGAAQEALERAETRLLDRAVPRQDVKVPDSGPVVKDVTAARLALGRGDVLGSKAAIGRATEALAVAHHTLANSKS